MRTPTRFFCGLGLGLLLSSIACDDPEPTNECLEFLTCYVDCRTHQYARGDDETISKAVLHGYCVNNECEDMGADLEHVMYLKEALEVPEDEFVFWEGLRLCVYDGPPPA